MIIEFLFVCALAVDDAVCVSVCEYFCEGVSDENDFRMENKAEEQESLRCRCR